MLLHEIFKTFKKVLGFQCQVCQRSEPKTTIRESPKTGFWCMKHWCSGPRCSEPGCDEPIMSIHSGGDGNKCRAHIYPDELSWVEREMVLRGYGNDGWDQLRKGLAKRR